MTNQLLAAPPSVFSRVYFMWILYFKSKHLYLLFYFIIRNRIIVSLFIFILPAINAHGMNKSDIEYQAFRSMIKHLNTYHQKPTIVQKVTFWEEYSQTGKYYQIVSMEIFPRSFIINGKKFGFARHPRHPNILIFRGILSLYQEIADSGNYPVSIVNLFIDSFKRIGFFPSPEGLEVIMAICRVESVFRWDRLITNLEIRLLSQVFSPYFDFLNQEVFNDLVKFIISKDDYADLKQLITRFKVMIDVKTLDLSEYDVYKWNRDVSLYLTKLSTRYPFWYFITDLFFDLNENKNRLSELPRTFGLFQVNVEHFIEISEIHRRYSKEYLVKVISGKVNKEKDLIMDLIFRYYIRPRYDSHLQGKKDDLKYFISEFQAGYLSTFKAAIQKKLNDIMNTKLIIDGDLAIYNPNSLTIDWRQISATQNVLTEFIKGHTNRFNKPISINQLIKDLCLAKDYHQLKTTELYRVLMSAKKENRVFPDVKSHRYQQSNMQYVRHVWSQLGNY